MYYHLCPILSLQWWVKQKKKHLAEALLFIKAFSVSMPKYLFILHHFKRKLESLWSRTWWSFFHYFAPNFPWCWILTIPCDFNVCAGYCLLLISLFRQRLFQRGCSYHRSNSLTDDKTSESFLWSLRGNSSLQTNEEFFTFWHATDWIIEWSDETRAIKKLRLTKIDLLSY